MPDFDLEIIKREIDERRAGQLVTEGVSGNRMGAPKESKKFLADLLTSYQSGIDTPAVKALRNLTESSDAIYGAPTTIGRPSVPPQQGYQPQQNQQPLNETYMPQQQFGGMDRDNSESHFDRQMQAGIERLRQRGTPQTQQPGAGLSQALNEYAGSPFVGQPMAGGSINAGALNEHISKTMNEMTNNTNFVKLVEGAYKNMLNEMYAKEKIETALVEIIQSDSFKKIMKKTIVDTLLEIQNRNKPKV